MAGDRNGAVACNAAGKADHGMVWGRPADLRMAAVLILKLIDDRGCPLAGQAHPVSSAMDVPIAVRRV